MARSEKTEVTLKPFKSKRPNENWIVYYPNETPGNRRKYKRFRTKFEAEQFKIKKEAKLTNHNREVAALSDSVIREAVWASEQLKPYGRSITEVVQEYIKTHSERQDSLLLPEAFDQFYQHKVNLKQSDRYLADMRQRPKRFAYDFPDHFMSDVDVLMIEAWLEDLEVESDIPVAPITRNNYRRDLSVFFSWGADRGFCAENPVPKIPKAKEVHGRVEIFDQNELQVVLNQAPVELLPFFAIGAFCGLRSEEIRRLEWRAIDFKRERIDVTAKVAKSPANRYVPLCPALENWLKRTPSKERSGEIVPSRLYKKLTTFRSFLANEEVAERDDRPVVSWKHNGMRHSFASYALAREQDAGKVATWMGHRSTTMIYRHYFERVTKEEATDWFEVFPK